MKNIDLSIIIISYNTEKLLRSCLDTLFSSLQHVSICFEVIVIDNASIDGSVKMVQTVFPNVKLIQNQKNSGFGSANNQGAEVAQGATLLFLNSDIQVLDTAVDKLYTFFISRTGDVIVGGKLFNTDMTPQSSCGPKYSLINIFVALFLKGDYLQLTRYSPIFIKEVDWVMGACIMMSKDFFMELRFDAGIFMYMEEIDLQKRAKNKGARIYFYPEAHFIHVGHASSGGRESPILNVFRGLMYFYRKHGNYIQNSILRILLLLKSFSAIILFTLMGKKYDRNIYIKALKIVI